MAEVLEAATRATSPSNMEESGGPDPQRLCAHPLSRRGLRPWQVHSPWAEDGVLETNPMGPRAFQAVTAPWRLHPPRRRAENSNPTPKRALVSCEARPLAGSPSTLFTYAGRDLHPHTLSGTGFWDLRVYIPPPAHGVTDRI